jgi:hypothetical protein
VTLTESSTRLCPGRSDTFATRFRDGTGPEPLRAARSCRRVGAEPAPPPSRSAPASGMPLRSAGRIPSPTTMASASTTASSTGPRRLRPPAAASPERPAGPSGRGGARHRARPSSDGAQHHGLRGQQSKEGRSAATLRGPDGQLAPSAVPASGLPGSSGSRRLVPRRWRQPPPLHECSGGHHAPSRLGPAIAALSPSRPRRCDARRLCRPARGDRAIRRPRLPAAAFRGGTFRHRSRCCRSRI